MNVIEVDARGSFACARKADGSVYCWGTNSFGQLGLGGGLGGYASTARRASTSNILQLGLGDNHARALRGDSQVLCWGSRYSLGRGASSDSTMPAPVLLARNVYEMPLPLSGLVSVGGGSSHTCAVLGSGTSFCWGPNGSGQLGNTASQPAVGLGYLGDWIGVIDVALDVPPPADGLLVTAFGAPTSGGAYATPSLFQP